MDIPGWRRKIDEIDMKVLELLNERARCAVEIGRIKKENNIAVMCREREDMILENIVGKNAGPLGESQIREVFALIMKHSRSLQQAI